MHWRCLIYLLWSLEPRYAPSTVPKTGLLADARMRREEPEVEPEFERAFRRRDTTLAIGDERVGVLGAEEVGVHG
jgi:hypothetical protein